MIEADNNSFYAEVIERSHEVPVLVDFWAPWCQPCRILGPVLEKLEKEYKGKFLLVKVNTEQNQEIAAHYSIRSIPAVKLFKAGNPIDEFVGALPEGEIKKFLRKVVPSETDIMIKEGDELYLSGQFVKAAGIYNAVLEKDPRNERAILSLARVYYELGEFSQAKELIENLDYIDEAARLLNIIYFKEKEQNDPVELGNKLQENPKDLDARIALGDHYAKEGEYLRAMDEFLAAIKKDKKYKDETARKSVLRIFSILGSDNPAVTEYRSKLSDILF